MGKLCKQNVLCALKEKVQNEKMNFWPRPQQLQLPLFVAEILNSFFQQWPFSSECSNGSWLWTWKKGNNWNGKRLKKMAWKCIRWKQSWKAIKNFFRCSFSAVDFRKLKLIKDQKCQKVMINSCDATLSFDASKRFWPRLRSLAQAWSRETYPSFNLC